MKLGALAAAVASLVVWCAPAVAQAAAGPFADWAAIFVAGDWRGHAGGPTEAFDNARRDLAKAFVAEGFSPQNVRQFSVHPEQYPDTAPFVSDIETIHTALESLTKEAKGGCLIYFTSHGNTDGAVVGDTMFGPRMASLMLDAECGERPTVVVISACYSGVFVPALAAPNRMVLTAARPDRSSFGCGEADKYPYFDQCMLQSLPGSPDFATLGRTVQACVANREKAEHVGPPSEPQMYIGGELRPVLPLLALQYPGETRTAAAH